MPTGGGSAGRVMSMEAAQEWAKNSAVKGVFYHGTSTHAAEGIGKEGFSLEHAGEGADREMPTGTYKYGHGVFLTNNAEIAERYATHSTDLKLGVEFKNVDAQEGQILKAMVNVENPAEGPALEDLLNETLGRVQAAPSHAFDGSEYASTLRDVAQEHGYDALVGPGGADHEVVVLDPKNVAVIEDSARDATPLRSNSGGILADLRREIAQRRETA